MAEDLATSCEQGNSKFVMFSKINLVQGALAVLAVLSDPGIPELNIIPLEYLPRICWAANALTFLLRTFFSGSKLSLKFNRGRIEEELGTE